MKEQLRERAREKFMSGEPIKPQELLAFSEYPFPGLRIMLFKKTNGSFIVAGDVFLGELTDLKGQKPTSKAMSFFEVMQDICSRKEFKETQDCRRKLDEVL